MAEWIIELSRHIEAFVLLYSDVSRDECERRFWDVPGACENDVSEGRTFCGG
jgi:hypothetical protein